MQAKATAAIELIPHRDLTPSTYNPRLTDPARLELVELSLRKFGWLLPAVACGREIISGHQRHLIAPRCGPAFAEAVPVIRLPDLPLDARKALNVACNRGTNDQAKADTTEAMTAEMERAAIWLERIRELPDTPDPFPCMRAVEMPPAAVLLGAGAEPEWNPYQRLLAGMLDRAGFRYPIIRTASGQIINGVGRLEHALTEGWPTVAVVTLADDRAALARCMLNLLTMDFDVHRRYADMLRYNSFRRTIGKKANLGRAFSFEAFGNDGADLTDRADRDRWLRHYGGRVLDWGAGHGTDAARLEQIGVQCDQFEPYRLIKGRDLIDPEAGRRSAATFLQAVGDGVEWQSIFQNSVMNSVPFAADRLSIVAIIAALCSRTTRVYACAAGVTHPRYIEATSPTTHYHKIYSAGFPLGYEAHTTLADLTKAPKVQKYHTVEEWRTLWATGFQSVHARPINCNVLAATCGMARRPQAEYLRQALQFEFDLPYPDGTRMGLVGLALEMFEKRCGLRLRD